MLVTIQDFVICQVKNMQNIETIIWSMISQYTVGFAVCQVGTFQRSPTTRCGYLECILPADPWPDATGVVPVLLIFRPCAPGSGVPLGYGGGIDNPCTDNSIPECGGKLETM